MCTRPAPLNTGGKKTAVGPDSPDGVMVPAEALAPARASPLSLPPMFLTDFSDSGRPKNVKYGPDGQPLASLPNFLSDFSDAGRPKNVRYGPDGRPMAPAPLPSFLSDFSDAGRPRNVAF